MTEASEREDITALRAALQATSGDERLDDLLRGSLFSAIAGDDAMVRVFREETAPEQALLDLHLTGDSVHQHATNAVKFANFVRKMALAVKWTAKQIANADSYQERVLIEGAAPGSVRLVLRVPDSPTTQDDLPGSAVPSADSVAMRRISRVFTNASTDDTGAADTLLAQIQQLPEAAKQELRRAVDEVLRAGWDVQGELVQRHFRTEEVQLTRRGAEMLYKAIRTEAGPPERVVRIGVFDGLRYQRGIAYFMPRDARGGPTFSAAVDEHDLLRRIALLTGQVDSHGHQVMVRAEFDEFTERAESGVQVRHSRVLKSFSELGSSPDTQDLFDSV